MALEKKISQVYVLLLLFFEQVVLLTQYVLLSRAVLLRTMLCVSVVMCVCVVYLRCRHFCQCFRQFCRYCRHVVVVNLCSCRHVCLLCLIIPPEEFKGGCITST